MLETTSLSLLSSESRRTQLGTLVLLLGQISETSGIWLWLRGDLSYEPGVAAGVLAIGAVLLALMSLRATGERRRGKGVGVALAAGLFFPITWTVWYLRDEHPYRFLRRT